MLKLAFEKAYDKVEWDCIRDVSRSGGFPYTSISWITSRLQSTKVSVLMNEIQGWKTGRVLRQEDHASPLIFVLVVDGLHHMIFICRKEGLLKGIRCQDDANTVINL